MKKFALTLCLKLIHYGGSYIFEVICIDCWAETKEEGSYELSLLWATSKSFINLVFWLRITGRKEGRT